MIKSVIWVENEYTREKVSELIKGDSLSFSFFVSKFDDCSFRKVRKVLRKEDGQRIIKISTDLSRFDIYYKYNSVWTKVTFENLVEHWMSVNNLAATNKWNSPDSFKTGKEKVELDFPLNLINMPKSDQLFSFYLSSDKKIDIFDNKSITMPSNNEQFSFKIYNEENFEDFKNNFIKTEDLDFADINIIDQNKLILKTSKGKIFLEKMHDVIYVFFSFSDNNSADLFYYSRAIKNNIKAIINKETRTIGERKKLDLKNATLIILSIIIVIGLMVITFKFIYNPANSKTAADILLSSYTWKNPWIYLMVINFIISLFLGLILSVVLQWFTPGRGKVNYKNALKMWVGLQIRMVTVFLTGNAFIATFIWGLYVVKVTKVKTMGFAGMLASINILRGVIMIPIGFLFMTRSTFYEANILNSIGKSSEFITFTTLSWIGWIWGIIHHLSMSLLIILPPLHILVNRVQEAYYGKNKSFEQATDKMQVFEMQITSLKKSFGSMFRDKKRITRTTSMIVIAILIETFEFTYSLRMVEDYGIYVKGYDGLEKANYYNVFALSSIRYSVNFIHSVPIINLIPGQGLGITDFALNDTTSAIIANKHIELYYSNNDLIEKMSDETTLIIRFFNFFLKRLVALAITLSFLIKYFIIKKIKK